MWGLNHVGWPAIPDYESYDLIFMLENHDDIGWIPDLSKTKKPYKVCWAIDAHGRTIAPFEHIYRMGKYNLLLHATLDYCDHKERIWFPNSFDNELLYPMDVPKRAHVGFCGTVGGREEYINLLMGQKFTFMPDIFVIGESMVRAINSYKIHFNKNVLNDINYRSFETIGCGIPLLTNHNYQYDLLGFKDMVNCMLYKDKTEMIAKIHTVLSDENTLNTIAANGHTFSKVHNYTERVKHLVSILKDKI